MAKRKTVAAPEPDPEVAEVDPAVEDAVQAIADAQQAVVDAQTNLGEAKQVHEEAVAAHAALTAPPLPVVGKQYLVEGFREPRDLSAGDIAEFGAYPRRILVNGIIYDHVSEAPGQTDEGEPAVAWVYRRA